MDGNTSLKFDVAKKAGAKKLRLAFLGAGGISRTHMDALSKMDDVEIVALGDPKRQPMEQWAEQFKVPKVYTDWRKMLKEVQPEAVSVCSSNGAHEENAIAAMAAGAHVIVEKPMAMNVKQAQNMINAAKKYKRKLVIGFQYRYHPATTFIKESVDAGVLGDIKYARVQALRRRGIPNWGVFVRKELQGGGPMIDIGVHVLEMTHYAMGSPKPISAIGNTFTYLGNKPSNKIRCSWAGWDFKHHNIEDLAVGQIRFDNGAVLTLEASFAAHIEKDQWNFNLMGTKGGAQWDPATIYTDTNGHMVNVTPAWLGKGDFGTMFASKLRNFVDYVTKNTPPTAPGEAGLMVQKMLNGIYDSADKGGKEVKIV